MNRAGTRHFQDNRSPVGLFAWLLAAACITCPALHAEQMHSITGWIQPATAPYDRYGQFVVLGDPLDRVRAILHDPQGLLTANLPARLRLRATITQPRGPLDEPVFRLAHAETGSTADSDAASGTGATPWTDLADGLFHPAMNVTPRLMSLTSADEDGDSFPDDRDILPGFPDEWRDADKDGVGDNADSDDDNDGMSDNYEILCGLNPLVADAHADADGDGMSNGGEARAGTLANDASSLFALSVEADAVSGKLNVRWPALPARVYSLEVADSTSGRWFRLLEGLRPSSPTIHSFSFLPAEQPAAYFRAIADYP
jgi:hypothetical protein